MTRDEIVERVAIKLIDAGDHYPNTPEGAAKAKSDALEEANISVRKRAAEEKVGL